MGGEMHENLLHENTFTQIIKTAKFIYSNQHVSVKDVQSTYEDAM